MWQDMRLLNLIGRTEREMSSEHNERQSDWTSNIVGIESSQGCTYAAFSWVVHWEVKAEVFD
jgi:hypothetical protein